MMKASIGAFAPARVGWISCREWLATIYFPGWFGYHLGTETNSKQKVLKMGGPLEKEIPNLENPTFSGANLLFQGGSFPPLQGGNWHLHWALKNEAALVQLQVGRPDAKVVVTHWVIQNGTVKRCWFLEEWAGLYGSESSLLLEWCV